jgi:hypothetical protein
MGVNEEWVTKKDLAAAVEPLASKQDLAQLRAEVKQDMAQLRVELKQDMVDLGDKLTEAIRDSQTEVLRAFQLSH